MISTRDRRQAIELIDEAVAAGARKARACAALGLSLRTVQRWTRDGGVGEDRRPHAERSTPPNGKRPAKYIYPGPCRSWNMVPCSNQRGLPAWHISDVPASNGAGSSRAGPRAA
jgi:hypothetical protein